MNEPKITNPPTGLTSQEVQQRLLTFGPNVVEEKKPHKILNLLKKFWSPIPWMLEVTIILQLVIGKYDEAIIFLLLLIFNSLLSFFQEERANKSLALLKQQLAIQARVLRDGHWQLISAHNLVPEDVVHLRMGDISPADIHLIDGKILVDQSILTGEALPIESEIGMVTYSGSLIKKGEATGTVIATGKNTYFGKSVNLLQTAKAKGHIQSVIFSILKYLLVIDIIFVLIIFIYSLIVKLPIIDIIPFIIIIFVASVPVALPATFTLATAFGAIQLAKNGVLITRLMAIEDAASIDILCSDKTGTITQNQLDVTHLISCSPYTDEKLLTIAAMACDESTQDPIDKAILSALHSRYVNIKLPERIAFIPFDPAYKRAEAVFRIGEQKMMVLKGAPDIIAHYGSISPEISDEILKIANTGCRVLAIAIGKDGDDAHYALVGIIGLSDPPRENSKSCLNTLKELGLRTIMLTGDNAITAKNIAMKVGLGNRACSAKIIKEQKEDIVHCDIFAGVFPEDKFNLVQALQHAGHIIAMTGDGVNDAPALKQANVGIAVSNATDIAKSAASIVLTGPGLNGIINVVDISRRIYQRMLTYTLNKIIKSLEIIVFLSVGVILSGSLIITPFLIVLLLFTNDFMTMSIASDNTSFSLKPQRWQIANLMLGAGIIAALVLLLSFVIFTFGRNYLHLPLPQLQTLIFVMLVITGQGNVYLVRERGHFWDSAPGKWLIIASVLDIAIVSILAIQGIFMAAVTPWMIGALLIVIILYLILIDFIKIKIFAYLKIK